MAKRRRRRSQQVIVAEQAVAYGVTVPPEPSASERFLSPNDIAKILNVTGEAVKQWIYHRRLPAVKLANGYWKVKVSDFEAYQHARYEVGRRDVLIMATANPQGLGEVIGVVEELGHRPVAAQNRTDALLKAHDRQPALFIIHLAQGEDEQWKLAQTIRKDKSLRKIPILFVAGSELSEADTERAIALSAQGLLVRPFTRGTLASEIARVMCLV
jgi:CheY-like chemotaxis protein